MVIERTQQADLRPAAPGTLSTCRLGDALLKAYLFDQDAAPRNDVFF